MITMRSYVILGSGVAGISAAEEIRTLDPDGEIIIISNERAGYYSRPGLAYLLTGEIPEHFLFPYHKEDYRRLREDAERRLGDRFDLREFHDLVLEDGAVPLWVLREKVEGWSKAISELVN